MQIPLGGSTRWPSRGCLGGTSGLPAYWAEASLGYSLGPSPHCSLVSPVPTLSTAQEPQTPANPEAPTTGPSWVTLRLPPLVPTGWVSRPCQALGNTSSALQCSQDPVRALLCAFPCGAKALHTQVVVDPQEVGTGGQAPPHGAWVGTWLGKSLRVPGWGQTCFPRPSRGLPGLWVQGSGC